jgi:hypothetical protein
VPTKAEWDAVSNININPVRERIGTFDLSDNPTNYSSGIRIGSGNTGLFLPTTGVRGGNGVLFNRGGIGRYYSSSQSTTVGSTGITIPSGWYLRVQSANFDTNNQVNRASGFSIRCIKQ